MNQFLRTYPPKYIHQYIYKKIEKQTIAYFKQYFKKGIILLWRLHREREGVSKFWPICGGLWMVEWG